MSYASVLSDNEWRGPFVIRTPDQFGRFLHVKGSISWRDQGWGGEKGTVKIVLVRDGVVNEESETKTRLLRSNASTINLDTGLLTQHWKRGDEIHVSFLVGGGGGH